MELLKSRWMVGPTFLVAGASAFLAYAEDKKQSYDPSGFIQEKAQINTDPTGSQLKEAETRINGVPYKIYRNEQGTILIPDVGRFRPSDLDTAECTNSNVGKTDDGIIARAEKKLSKKMAIYAELIQQTIVAKCHESTAMKVYAKPNAEIGIRYQDKEKRDAATYKLYKNYSEPGIGAGVEF